MIWPEHPTRLNGLVTARQPYSYPLHIRPIFGENYGDPCLAAVLNVLGKGAGMPTLF